MAYLWITRYPPTVSGRGGDFVYSRDIIESLAAIHPVRGLAYGPSNSATKPAAGWTTMAEPKPYRLASLGSHLPSVAFRYRSEPFASAAIDEARNAEAIFIDFLAMAWLVRPIRCAIENMRDRPPIIFFTHNYEFEIRDQLWRSAPGALLKLALRWDALKAKRLEHQAVAEADGVTAITVRDGNAFATLGAKAVAIVPPIYRGRRVDRREINDKTSRRVCILGNFNAHHRRAVVVGALEQLAMAGPLDFRLDVVGEGPVDDLRKRFPSFNFLGYVDDLAAYLADVRLGILPDFIGGGFKMRALTYAFHRVPMLAVRPALSGMGLVEGRDYLEVEDCSRIAPALASALDDFSRLNAMQRSAFDAYTWIQDSLNPGRELDSFARQLKASRATVT